MNDIYKLLQDDDWEQRMMHQIPVVPVISREQYLMQKCKDKTVLDIGGSGPMADGIKFVARRYVSLDRQQPADYVIDIDRADSLPEVPGLDLVIAGEVIEHLSNAGHFLDLLHVYTCPIILTTPNAFCSGMRASVRKGYEQVNAEHVCYYSWYTLTNLLNRHGWKVREWYWYNGEPMLAEGMIFKVTSQGG